MGLRSFGAAGAFTGLSRITRVGSARRWLFGGGQLAVWLRLALLAVGLPWLGAGCTTWSARLVTDPAPAVARLQAGGSIRHEVDQLAQPLVEGGEIYGVAVGVLTPDGCNRTFGYGRTGRAGEPQVPEGDTIFQVGSVSKLFLTALLAVLEEEGTLHYEDTVRSILPAEVPLNKEVGDVTLLELATCTGGFPRQPFCPQQLRDFTRFLFTGRNLYAYLDKPYLYDYLGHIHIKPKGQRHYVYSNIGFGLLAHLIEVKTGRSIAALLQEKICGPLQLHDTTFVLSPEQQRRLAVGHAGVQPRFVRRGHPMAPWDMGEVMGPAGCLYSSVNDLLRFARASMGRPPHCLSPVLASTQRVQLSRPDEDVALGWLVNYLGDGQVQVTYKQGVVAGYTAYVGMNPETGLAVVVLYNTFSWDEKVGHNLILRLTRGLPVKVAAARP